MRFLVTAGSTREKIDLVRVWGNIFTGNTGFAIAQALAGVGEVDLLTSNGAHAVAAGKGEWRYPIRAATFGSHAELRGLLEARMTQAQYAGVFMSAAVSDYAPVRVYAVESRRAAGAGDEGREEWVVRDVQAGKVKSHHPMIAILGEQTEKLVDLFRRKWGHRGLLVKFKLEVGITPEELIRIGQASRLSSGADYLVANTLEMVEGAGAGAYLLSDSGQEWVPREGLPARIAALARAQGMPSAGQI